MDPITGGLLLGGSALSAFAGLRGADKQADAAQEAARAQLAMYNQTRKDNMPWLEAGRSGLNALMDLYGMGGGDASAVLANDPSYKFRFQQGQNAIENSAAARGSLMSGNALRALTNYGQDYASQEFGNIANRLSGLAGIGQQQAQYLGGVNMNNAAAMGQNYMNAGAARASGYAAGANAIGNGLGQLAFFRGMSK